MEKNDHKDIGETPGRGEDALPGVTNEQKGVAPVLGVAPAEPGAGPSAVSPPKAAEDAAAVPNAVLGYFTRGPLKYMLVRVDEVMLVGIDITTHGKVHTMHTGISSVHDLVLTGPLTFDTPPIERPESVAKLVALANRAIAREAFDLSEYLLAFARHLNGGRNVVPEAAGSGMQR